jgi:hypothetical protein
MLPTRISIAIAASSAAECLFAQNPEQRAFLNAALPPQLRTAFTQNQSVIPV